MQYAPAPTSIIFVWGQKLFIVRDGRGGISTLMLMYCHLPLLVLRSLDLSHHDGYSCTVLHSSDITQRLKIACHENVETDFGL
jgi:hypothetical protein